VTTPAPRRIGIFGGSFDPVHDAHLALAVQATADLALDALRWVPAGQPWQKTRPLTDAHHREAMLRLAIDGRPGWTLSRYELERAGPSYTLDTVRAMQTETPGAAWWLLIGQDQYDAFTSWHGWQELLERVTLAVARRPGPHGMSIVPATPPGPATARGVIAHATVALPLMGVSSSDIRARCAAGRPVDDLVPPAVARYIARHRLYQGNQGKPGS
jgi:nicotinate-nucleotide adenylyltransferase